MRRAVVCGVLVAVLASPCIAGAQDHAVADPAETQQAAKPVSQIDSQSFFAAVGSDFKRFFSKDTATVMGMMSVASIAAVPWDREGLREGLELPAGFFKPGKIAGSVLFQSGVAALTIGVGKMTDSDKAVDVGRDIIRGQIVSQTMVQALKVIVRRERPDHSNRSAFPSGHSASSFTTAAIIQRHFGWKPAAPLYGFGVYVAMSRMSSNKHHISDVVMGAGLGLAAGRTVTLHTLGQKMGVGIAPTPGGASLTFTRIPK